MTAHAARFFNVQIFYSNFFCHFFTFLHFCHFLHFRNFYSVFFENEKRTPQWRESSNFLEENPSKILENIRKIFKKYLSNKKKEFQKFLENNSSSF